MTKILAIETSCDETAVTILECEGDEKNATFKILGNALLSQIELHQPYGGVFPTLAKREHQKNLPILFEQVMREANLEGKDIDAVAVTAGPGLEPALWVGIEFAKALAEKWQKPLIAANHMEGHILSALASVRSDLTEKSRTLEIRDVALPVLALLISGGHTELVVMNEWLKYELIGQTQDDSVGEAFDKVARMLGLPYPGGPQISKLAEDRRNHAVRSRLGTGSEGGEETHGEPIKLPRPMIHDNTCNFSFAGLKTAVLYALKDKELTDDLKKEFAHEFENAVADVLWKKTERALEKTGAKTLVIGGGVSANTHIRREFTEKVKEYGDARPNDGSVGRVSLRIPAAALTTDNAIMIGLASYFRSLRKEFATDIKANGNLSLT